MPQHAERTRSLRRDGFTFKQFFVAHDRCAMKIGTDGVLLGAWAPLSLHGPMLDIGCGSGIIALMLAQRSLPSVMIDAVELDQAASEQARENVAASPWSQRIAVITADITHYATQTPQRYAVIVSNPPYFSPGVACRTRARDRARYTESLPHETLLLSAHQLLLPGGCFCVVLPCQSAASFIAVAQQQGWMLQQRFNVSENAGREPHRVLLALSNRAGSFQEGRLVIRDEEGHYSPAFRALTQNFYLFM